MGKNKKRSGHGIPSHPNKRKRTARYWIDSFHDSKPKEGSPLMTVIITQANLTDDHTHAPKRQQEESTGEDANTTSVAGQASVESKGNHGSDNDVINAVVVNVVPGATPNPCTPSRESPKPIDYKHAFISVRRTASASAQPRKFPDQDFRPLPNGDCGDGVLNPHPKSDVADKYWAQRRRLFSKFDDGIQMDKEGWFSVTPEAIADHIAKRVVKEGTPTRHGMVVLDAFCGCGGNAIAFAKRPEISLVVCVDTDLSKLEMAANNASIYKIPMDKLLFVHDNATRVLSWYASGRLDRAQTANPNKEEDARKLEGYPCNGSLPERLDCIFLSPPWGGIDYGNVGKSHFNLESHIQLKGHTNKDMDEEATDTNINGEELLTMSVKASKRVVYFLPRNLNGITMGRSALQAGCVGTMELEKNVLNGKFKTVTAYFGFDKQETTNEACE